MPFLWLNPRQPSTTTPHQPATTSEGRHTHLCSLTFPTSVGSNPGAATDLDTVVNTNILAQLWFAATEEHELQIISATIQVQAAALAWSLQHGVIRYNDRCYIPATSPLLQDLLDAWGTTSPNFWQLDSTRRALHQLLGPSPLAYFCYRHGQDTYYHPPQSSSMTMANSSCTSQGFALNIRRVMI